MAGYEALRITLRESELAPDEALKRFAHAMSIFANGASVIIPS